MWYPDRGVLERLEVEPPTKSLPRMMVPQFEPETVCPFRAS